MSRAQSGGLDRRRVLALWRHEIRLVLRDRRTILLSIILPVLLMPVLFALSRWSGEVREQVVQERTYYYAVEGVGAEEFDAWSRAGAAAEDASIAQLERQTLDDPAKALAEESLDAYLRVRPWVASDRSSAGDETEGDTSSADAQWTVELHYQGNAERSQGAARALRELLAEGRRAVQEQQLIAHGVAYDARSLAEYLKVHELDHAASEAVGSGKLSQGLTAMLAWFVVVGAQLVAADIIAGERERGTLETLLTCALARREIAWAKLLATLSVALAICLLHVGNLAMLAGLGLTPTAETGGFELEWRGLCFIALGMLPIAALLSSVLLILSARAESFKAAQLAFIPVQFLAFVPALVTLLPGVSLRSIVALVPISNTALLIREALSGRPDYVMAVVVVGVNLGYAYIGLRVVTGILDGEAWLRPGAKDAGHRDGRARFAQHLLAWMAVVWAILLIRSVNTSEFDLAFEVIANIVVIMLGAAIVSLRVYRLNAREAWKLRWPRAWVWPLVALGVPSLWIVGHGAFLLADQVVPAPAEMLQKFGSDLMDHDLPMWQTYLLIAVVPGVCEEILFRGSFLYAATRRYTPVVACLVVGVAFAVFHVSLFRLAPTFVLGVGFAATTLLTRSIAPAMVWHVLNNALALYVGTHWPGSELPLWSYPVATMVLAGCYLGFWRMRPASAAPVAPGS